MHAFAFPSLKTRYSSIFLNIIHPTTYFNQSQISLDKYLPYPLHFQIPSQIKPDSLIQESTYWYLIDTELKMSGAPGRPGGAPPGGRAAIRGPQSALTDYLASHNISAQQIRADADARRAAAASAAAQRANAVAEGSGAANDDNAASAMPEVTAAPARIETALQKKTKLAREKAIAKIKASKDFQNRMSRGGSYVEGEDEDEAARKIFEASYAPLPDQMADCKVCGINFAVTAYSAAGPDGSGFLCPKCTQEFEDSRPRKKRASQGRKARSDALDLVTSRGPKDLVTLCVETLAKHVDMAEDLGDLPEALVDRVAQLLSKYRLITPSNVDVFFQATWEHVTIYDCAKLQPDDFIRMFQMVPRLRHLRIRNCIQFKNTVMQHLIDCPTKLESFSIAGANLIDDEHWSRFVFEKGSYLRSLKVYHTDNHFGDEHLELIASHCPDLVRLKVTNNQKVTSAGLYHIAKLKNLQHLTLEIYKRTDTEPYIAILKSVGHNLRTLCLRKIEYLDDSVLEAIHNNCVNLRKLCLSDNETFSDRAIESLFTEWSNPPLTYIDLHKCRHVDSAVPTDNPDSIGLCSAGFISLMKHSGSHLKHLNICADRHISREAFETVFAPGKMYEKLERLDVSFCWGVNDDVISAIFRCANKGTLKAVKTFGNFGVSSVWDPTSVPQPTFLIGIPTGMGMHIEGEAKALTW